MDPIKDREKLFPLADVPARLPDVSLSSVRRWALIGVLGVKLETCRIGRRRFTHEAALRAFCEAVNAARPRSTVATA